MFLILLLYLYLNLWNKLKKDKHHEPRFPLFFLSQWCSKSSRASTLHNELYVKKWCCQNLQGNKWNINLPNKGNVGRDSLFLFKSIVSYNFCPIIFLNMNVASFVKQLCTKQYRTSRNMTLFFTMHFICYFCIIFLWNTTLEYAFVKNNFF